MEELPSTTRSSNLGKPEGSLRRKDKSEIEELPSTTRLKVSPKARRLSLFEVSPKAP
jgi:hypothetical protein